MTDNWLAWDLEYLESVYFAIQYRTDKMENMRPEDWGINVYPDSAMFDEEERLLKRGWIAENPLTAHCYYLTKAGGNALGEDVITPFDKAIG